MQYTKEGIGKTYPPQCELHVSFATDVNGLPERLSEDGLQASRLIGKRRLLLSSVVKNQVFD
jgi:hypothetical protein